MKKKVSVLLIVLAIMALGILAWFYGYYNNKSNDNLPNLTSIATMDEAEVNELLVGYRKIQLREVWNEPDETNSNEDVWIINERTALTVSYNNKDKVVVCGLSTEKSLNPASQTDSIEELQVKYPEYFELITSKGLEVYAWQMAENDYRFGLMPGTNREKILDELMALKGATADEMALILSTYDIEDKSIFVIPWQNPISSYMVTEDMAKGPEYINNIRSMLGLDGASMSSTEIDGIATQKLTLDDVVMLSQKGDELTWSDFERYLGREVGSGLYIMCYDINELFDVLVGGVPEKPPMYIDLRVHNKADDSIDIRTDDVPAFIAAHYDDLPRVDEPIESLNKLDYQSGTCDGLPEYQLIAADGTVYSINFSEKWVWRGNSEQAELPTELSSQLKRVCDVMDEEKPLETRPDEAISQTETQEIALNECKVNYDYIKAEFDTDKNAWNIGFWEDNAQIASQTILIDTTGKVLSIGYAE